ncbi:MAG: tRNA pseudouridine(38-40) synthase TruA [Pyrinomonadaceae bacterium]|nr:tRNA pseudouridine(38-40) synthase TruA [Pyrinomonadaceae bacterium]MCX7639264.1 tRNA pseudouridine(38-40) synthase TruA [Pyrinomonadaceae bacterium]MDW8303514.1 tRNA pseudouridine(38-40) synthase TruA [Acidobacteriota bacterium]
MNFKLLIQYDGTDFHGWQIQKNKRTVQGELQRVLSLLEGSRVYVCGSGRTDAGVHAEGQVANVKMTKSFTAEKLRQAINGNLGKDIRVIFVERVDEQFHARFSAKSKTYVYRVVNSPVMSPFWLRYALHEARSLDMEKIKRAAEILIGEHDWTAFSCADDKSRSKIRTIFSLDVKTRFDDRAQAKMIEFYITGNGFLRYMVRSIVGTLLEVGLGKLETDSIRKALETGNKKFVGATAPAHGLTLLRVSY